MTSDITELLSILIATKRLVLFIQCVYNLTGSKKQNLITSSLPELIKSTQNLRSILLQNYIIVSRFHIIIKLFINIFLKRK